MYLYLLSLMGLLLKGCYVVMQICRAGNNAKEDGFFVSFQPRGAGTTTGHRVRHRRQEWIRSSDWINLSARTPIYPLTLSPSRASHTFFFCSLPQFILLLHTTFPFTPFFFFLPLTHLPLAVRLCYY